MDHPQTSHDLLAHFDGPRIAGVECCGDTQVPGVERRDNNRVPGVERSEPPTRSNQRNTLWIVGWTAAGTIVLTTAVVLLQFVRLLAAEHALDAAARAGATEATLPRATHQSVSAAVDRHLANYPAVQNQLQLTLLRNGQPVGPRLQATEGDRFSISLSAPPTSFLPAWLARLSLHSGPKTIIASATRETPGRKLQPASP